MILRNLDKIIREQGEQEEDGYIFNQVNLIGGVLYYVKHLGGAAIFLVLLRPEAEDNIKLMRVDESLSRSAFFNYKFMTDKIRHP